MSAVFPLNSMTGVTGHRSWETTLLILIHREIDMSHFGDRLKEERKSLGLTQREMGIRPAKSSTQPCKAKTWCALKFKWAPVLAF